ncbi:DUF6596 domain-containing protein [Thalassobaculum sp.]|uniref:RNA polymerase sigma factor n=1 Tax=Thalassobaculum sp. TaxID=2022740 RepID=UPI0032EF9961
MGSPDEPKVLVEHFFRQQWTMAIAGLAAQFGPARLDDIENAVSGAMVKAVERWAISGVPDNPGGWIYQVARNILRDGMRRRQIHATNERHVVDALYAEADRNEPVSSDPLNDDVLKLMFVCCDPGISLRDSIVLTLRVVCGLGFEEIASGLCMASEAVRKSLFRCKQGLAKRGIPLDLPRPGELGERLGDVLQIVYLVFNAGYYATGGKSLIRDDLCREAERLMHLLQHSQFASDGRVWALSALLAFQASRLSARVDPSGRILLLSEQDRGEWNRESIGRGFSYLRRSMAQSQSSQYHLEAAIAACHASADSYQATDWQRILGYYDALLERTDSPVVRLNRAVAVMELRGAADALPVLGEIEGDPHFRHSFLLPSVMAECHRRLGNQVQATAYWAKAVALAPNRVAAEFLTERLDS